MSFSKQVEEMLKGADAKALATDGPGGLNVVPVSMIKVNQDSIWLFDFFMDKTRQNIQNNSAVALTAWTDMTGLQLRATAEYVTSGESFTQAVAWVQTQNPERVVKGLIILTPTDIFDVSPGGAFSTMELTF
jgi:predicted pyridoxine 5'-phosphate oxidase superfamily flavin-nucleotide-binding protein